MKNSIKKLDKRRNLNFDEIDNKKPDYIYIGRESFGGEGGEISMHIHI